MASKHHQINVSSSRFNGPIDESWSRSFELADGSENLDPEVTLIYDNQEIPNGEMIPIELTQRQPQVEWPMEPDQWYTLVMYDYDAPNPPYLHWSVSDIQNNSGKTRFRINHQIHQILRFIPTRLRSFDNLVVVLLFEARILEQDFHWMISFGGSSLNPWVQRVFKLGIGSPVLTVT